MNKISGKKHIFIVGAKCLGQYGGYETFLDKLTEVHQDHDGIQYYIATKANGYGCMDETKLDGVTRISENVFLYHNAKIFKLNTPEIGAAQAIYYDIIALNYFIRYAKENHIENPIFYILACRMGPAFGDLVRKAHRIGGVVYINPDGHEWKRAKWSKPIRAYWKKSEELMVKYADLIICDSVNIEKYIQTEYQRFHPETTFIAYGSDMKKSLLSDDDPQFRNWLDEKGLTEGQYYMCCGRFVPENSFEIMIREFMKSHSQRDFAIITTQDEKFLKDLDAKLGFCKDPRIKFVGTVYDGELLKKIRENAYANFHGHTVGGTNPSLLEAMGCTDVNLLINVGFNVEVAQDSALYWSAEEGNLADLIDQTDQMSQEERITLGKKAKGRMQEAYTWKQIGDRYENVWTKEK